MLKIEDNVKKILERIGKYVITPDVEDDFNNLKDYITNLQKELEMLVKDDERSQKTIIEQAQRIDKTIEYIKERYDYILKCDFLDHDEQVDKRQITYLLNILEGSDKE